jgi:molybdenum cofactor synthesis domain-containing protein
MIPLEEAQAYVLDRCQPLPPQRLPLRAARGRVIAEAVVCQELVPPFANTAVDGFAVRAADTAGASDAAPVALQVIETLAAGRATATEVGAGEAIRIMTGAPLPPGADAVVMVEHSRADPSRPDRVLLTRAANPGDAVRHAGEDMRPGQEVVAAGTVLGPGHLGVLATVGHLDAAVFPAPRVGVFSTGDELVGGGAPLAPGQIRDSNRYSLIALVEECGAEAVDLGLLPDDEDAIRDAIVQGAASCDALLTSGGVSMGDFDFVKKVLDEVGDMRWMQVAIKPAKPLAFGLVGDVAVFGLPGNPVSSMVSFELFARPALRKMMGHAHWHRRRVPGRAGEALMRAPDGKTQFSRVVAAMDAAGTWIVRSAGGQGSHQLHAMATAGALAVLRDGPGVAAGEPVELLLLGAEPWD